MIREDYGKLILRLALAGVFLYFGFSQLFDGVSWVGMVPAWAVSMMHLPPAMIVLMNGLLEVVLGAMLALGFFTRYAALILAIHLFVIAFDFGFNPIGIRDFGLSFATLAIFFLED